MSQGRTLSDERAMAYIGLFLGTFLAIVFGPLVIRMWLQTFRDLNICFGG